MSKRSNTSKRVISTLLVVATLLVLCTPIASAQGTDERTGISIKEAYSKVEGRIYSYAEGSYYSTVKMPKKPATFEAWVYIPKNVYSKDCGVIFGNYAGSPRDAYITYEILKGGVPCFLFSDNDGTVHEYEFGDAVIPSDTWTHLAIVYGAGDDYKEICCYINGEKKQTYGSRYWASIEKSFNDNLFSIAGDSSCLNSEHFLGILGDIAVYSDVRKEEYIKKDMTSPDLKDGALIAYYKLFGARNKQDIPDLSGNDYHMYYCQTWTTEMEMAALRADDTNKYAYTIALIPDTQYMAEPYYDVFHYPYDWLIENASKRNIQYALSMGDMTNDNNATQWERVKAQTDRLNGIVPYTVMRGNHDTTYNDGAEFFDEIYSDKSGYYYNHVKENGGFYDEDSVKNVYLLFSVGNVDYLILSLDFGIGTDVVDWANGILRQYPDRRAIVVTHAYLNSDGTTLAANDSYAPSTYEHYLNADYVNGDELWNDLIFSNTNVEIVASGHIHWDSIVVTEAYGRTKNTVYQVLVDAQTADTALGGLGMIALMYFTENGEFASVEYYSTVWKSYLTAKKSRTILKFAASEEETPPPVPTVDGNTDKPDVSMILTISCAVGTVAISTLGAVFVKRRRKK